MLRLPRGEALDAASRERQVQAHELETWKRVFLEQGMRGLGIRAGARRANRSMVRAKRGNSELAEYLID